MFDTLLASNASAPRRTGGTLVSFLVHTLLIAGAAFATARPDDGGTRGSRVEPIEYIAVRPAPPPPAAPRRTLGPTDVAPPRVPNGHQVLIAPPTIPDVLPPIDLDAAVTDPDDFTGRGTPGGRGDGIVGAPVPAAGDAGTTYLDVQVERQARAVAGSATPRYPELLRASRVEGRVLAQFVVDASGRADLSTFRAIESPHSALTDAVREAVGRMRFHPAEVGDSPVRQLVQMPFVFALR